MDKIYLQPNSQEIIIKGSSLGGQAGHTDVFAYDYQQDESKRKLGGLFIVGNVKREDDETEKPTEAANDSYPDIAYVINLIASLAKREYYSQPEEIPPKEAFSATLKKINSVVEEFFKNKSLKLNIGIFAVAGEQILISKLGKFKVILARDSRTIDILNNVDLFQKERNGEREFSNVISGKLTPGDKLFAFYPNRQVIAREKAIKASLLKSDAKEFLEKFNSIKETKPDFDCRALYISIDNHKEPALAKKFKPVIPETSLNQAENYVNLASVKPDLATSKPDLTKIETGEDIPSKNPELEPEEIPRIISSEFSLTRKVNPLLSSIKTLRRQFPSKISLGRKVIVLSLTVAVAIMATVLIKKFLIISPEQRKFNTVLNQARNDLKLAKINVSQNNFISARQLLAEALLNIYGLNASDSSRTQKTFTEIYAVLDDIDKAVEVSPSALETLPDSVKTRIAALAVQSEKLKSGQYGIDTPVAFDVYEDNLYILSSDNISRVADINQNGKKEATAWLKSGNLPSEPSMISVDGRIYVMSRSGTFTTFYKGEKKSEVNTYLVSSSGDILLTSKESDKLYLVNKTLGRIYEIDKESGTLVRTVKIGSVEPLVDAHLSGNNTIIIVTKDNRIWEIKETNSN